MKLARPDIFHPRIVLAGAGELGDEGDAGLIAALADRGLNARLLAWDDPQALDADLVILRTAGGERRAAFADWATRVPQLLNAPEVVAWNSAASYLSDLQCDGVATWEGSQPPPITALVFFGGGRSHAFGAEGADPDFELWDLGRAALRAAAERLSIRIDELLYARADVTGTAADPRLVRMDLVAPQFGWQYLDAEERQLAQRRFAVQVGTALDRLGLGPFAQRRP